MVEAQGSPQGNHGHLVGEVKISSGTAIWPYCSKWKGEGSEEVEPRTTLTFAEAAASSPSHSVYEDTEPHTEETLLVTVDCWCGWLETHSFGVVPL